MINTNITYKNAGKLSPWRKTSLSSWKPKGDSSCYCLEDIEVKELMALADTQGINFHTMLIKAIALTIEANPKINATVRFGKIYNRADISVFVHNVPKTADDDLDGLLFSEPQLHSLKDLDQVYKQKLKDSHKGNSEFAASKKIIGLLPAFCTKFIMNAFSFFSYTFNLNLGVFKLPKNAFGSVMLSSVGSLGIAQALCPIAPYTCVPMIIAAGKVREIAAVENGNFTAKKIITFGFTFDHRIMDGVHFASFLETFKQYIQNPESI
jgi:2-oxoacid dehydrogenases acyltransferase (catalytic domain)